MAMFILLPTQTTTWLTDVFLDFAQETHPSVDGQVLNGGVHENGFQTPTHLSEDEDGYEGRGTRGSGMHIMYMCGSGYEFILQSLWAYKYNNVIL